MTNVFSTLSRSFDFEDLYELSVLQESTQREVQNILNQIKIFQSQDTNYHTACSLQDRTGDNWSFETTERHPLINQSQCQYRQLWQNENRNPCQRLFPLQYREEEICCTKQISEELSGKRPNDDWENENKILKSPDISGMRFDGFYYQEDQTLFKPQLFLFCFVFCFFLTSSKRLMHVQFTSCVEGEEGWGGNE